MLKIDNELRERKRPYILLEANQRQNRENEQEISRHLGPNQNQANDQANQNPSSSEFYYIFPILF